MSSSAIAAIDGVIHLGAMSRALWGEHFPARCKYLNCSSVESLLDQIRRSNPDCWFLLASSKEVYGDAGSARVPEDAELRPKGIYATSKLDAERLVQEAAANGLRCGVARLSTVYGGLLDHPGRLIPSCVNAALTGAPLTVDSASIVVDPTHVEDVVRGLIKFATYLQGSTQARCTTVNLCAGHGVSIADIVSMVSECVPKPIITQQGEPRLYMSKGFVGSNEKAGALLDWIPRISVQDGLRNYVKMIAEVSDSAIAFRRSDFVQRLVEGSVS